MLKYLPNYMLPAEYEFMDKLEQTVNQKTNEAVLKRNVPKTKELKLNYTATADEKILINIWKKRLEVSNISVNDNFFRLGGNSLIALEIIADIKQEMHKSVDFANFFTHASIAQLARIMQQSRARYSA